jgi:hypothetical protein
VNNANQEGHEIIDTTQQQQVSEYPQQAGPDSGEYAGRHHQSCGKISHFTLRNSVILNALIAKFQEISRLLRTIYP